MPDNFSWPKVLTIAGSLAVAVFGGLWTAGAYMLDGVEQSITEFRDEAGEQFTANQQEDAASRMELVEAGRELRSEVAGLRKDLTAVGRIVSSNHKVSDRIEVILRTEVAGAIEKQGERMDARLDRIDRNTGDLRNEISFFGKGSLEQYLKRNVPPVGPELSEAKP